MLRGIGHNKMSGGAGYIIKNYIAMIYSATTNSVINKLLPKIDGKTPVQVLGEFELSNNPIKIKEKKYN